MDMSYCDKNVPNIVSLSHCSEQLYSCILNSYVNLRHVSIFGGDACESAWLKTVFYFLSACLLMCT